MFEEMIKMHMIKWMKDHPFEMKDIILDVHKNLGPTAKQELIKEFLGDELFKALQWCVECRENCLDLAKELKKV